MTINVAIAGGRKLLREGISLLLDKQPSLKVIGESADLETVPRLVQSLPIHVVILNDSVALPVRPEHVRAIRRANDAACVVVLALNPVVQWVHAMLEAGAAACLTKECESAELLAAIHAAHEGRLYLDPSLVQQVVRSQMNPASMAPTARSLAPREREILRRIGEGQATKEIAADLRVSTKTIETHRRRIMMKLNVFTVAELTKHAIRLGLTTLEVSV